MSTMTNILLSYSGRDANYRSLLVAATRAAGLPVRFVEVSGVVTDPVSRRALCAARLQQCEAAIVLASPHASRDAAVATDLTAARDHGLPVHAIDVSGTTQTIGGSRRRRAAWAVDSTHGWHWPRIAAFLQRLPQLDRRLALTG
jgi:hypothetical protein